MKKIVRFLAIVLLMSIVLHMYYDTVVQLKLANSGTNTELSGKLYSPKFMRINLNQYMNHTHDFVYLKSCNFITGIAEFGIREPIRIFHSRPSLPSTFWHPPQA